MFEVIKDVLHSELEKLAEKYDVDEQNLTGQDLEHIDMMAHALKCIATYEAMQGESRSRERYSRDRYRGRY